MRFDKSESASAFFFSLFVVKSILFPRDEV